MTNFFYFLTTGPCVSLFWANYTKIKICAICLLTFGPTCAIIFGPQRGLVGYDMCALHGHIFNNCPVRITGREFVILHKIICLSSKNKYLTTVPCVSLGGSSSFCTKFFVFLSWTHFQQLSRAYHWAGVCQEFFSSFCTKFFVFLIRTVIQQLSRVYHGAPPASSSFCTKFFVFLSWTNIRQLSRAYHGAPPARVA